MEKPVKRPFLKKTPIYLNHPSFKTERTKPTSRWDFLDKPFTLWVLTTVAAGVIGFAFTNYSTCRSAQDRDSEDLERIVLEILGRGRVWLNLQAGFIPLATAENWETTNRDAFDASKNFVFSDFKDKSAVEITFRAQQILARWNLVRPDELAISAAFEPPPVPSPTNINSTFQNQKQQPLDTIVLAPPPGGWSSVSLPAPPKASQPPPDPPLPSAKISSDDIGGSIWRLAWGFVATAQGEHAYEQAKKINPDLQDRYNRYFDRAEERFFEQLKEGFKVLQGRSIRTQACFSHIFGGM